MEQEKGIRGRLSREEMQFTEQIAQSHYEPWLRVEAQFAEQHPELWEEIRAELQKFSYYESHRQRILDDPKFCEQAIEDLGLIRQTFERLTDTPEDFRCFVEQYIGFVLSEYDKAALRWDQIRWGRISWSPDTGLHIWEWETD